MNLTNGLLALLILFIITEWIWIRGKGNELMAKASELKATVERLTTEVGETATVIREQTAKITELLTQLGGAGELQTEVDDAVLKLNQAADALDALQNPPVDNPHDEVPPTEPV